MKAGSSLFYCLDEIIIRQVFQTWNKFHFFDYGSLKAACPDSERFLEKFMEGFWSYLNILPFRLVFNIEPPVDCLLHGLAKRSQFLVYAF